MWCTAVTYRRHHHNHKLLLAKQKAKFLLFCQNRNQHSTLTAIVYKPTKGQYFPLICKDHIQTSENLKCKFFEFSPEVLLEYLCMDLMFHWCQHEYVTVHCRGWMETLFPASLCCQISDWIRTLNLVCEERIYYMKGKLLVKTTKEHCSLRTLCSPLSAHTFYNIRRIKIARQNRIYFEVTCLM